MDFYKEYILDHYQNPRNFGRMEGANVSFFLSNPLCGDEIKVYLKFKGNKVSKISFEGKGCVIFLASASLLTEVLKGKTKEAILSFDKNFMLELLKVPLGPNRLKCALLPLIAIQKAIKIKEKNI